MAFRFPTLALNYTGSKIGQLYFFDQLLLERPVAYCDLTGGSCICSIYMAERFGVRQFIISDCSPYARMIARALFCKRKLSAAEIEMRCKPRLTSTGWFHHAKGYDGPFPNSKIRAAIDGFCQHNAEEPLLLIALGALLSQAAMGGEFRYGLMKSLTIDHLMNMIKAKALRLAPRCRTDCEVRIVSWDYLNLPKEADALENWLVYLDPAWPQQPSGHKQRAGNDKIYGFYAQRVHSILQQMESPMPDEYMVSLEDAYAGMKRTAKRMIDAGSIFMLAYQSDPAAVINVKRDLVAGFHYEEVAAQRVGGSRMWEYLWRLRSARKGAEQL